MGVYVAAMLAGILLTAASQVLLRSGAKRGATWWESFWNVRTVIGYGLFVVVTVLNVFALQVIPLKTMTAWSSLTYVVTLVLARWILRERISPSVLLGVALIVCGVVVFSLGGAWS